MEEITKFNFKVVTPDGIGLDEETAFSKIPGQIGEIGIQPNHTASLSTLKAGELLYENESGDRLRFFIPEGIAMIKRKTVLVLTPYVESISDIDRSRAEQAKKRAQDRLEKKDEKLDRKRAEKSFQRAESRLKMLLAKK